MRLYVLLLVKQNRTRAPQLMAPQMASMFAAIFSGTVIGLGFAVVLTYQQVMKGSSITI
jgi:hypothetical protein